MATRGHSKKKGTRGKSPTHKKTGPHDEPAATAPAEPQADLLPTQPEPVVAPPVEHPPTVPSETKPDPVTANAPSEPAPVAAPSPPVVIPVSTTDPAPAPPSNWQPVPDTPPPPPMLPHFEPVAPRHESSSDQGATSAPQVTSGDDAEWVKVGTHRRGNPELAGLGGAMVLVGIALIGATYYWGVAFGNLFAPAGIRGDLIGAVLLLIGLIVFAVFLLVPGNRPSGLTPDAPVEDVENMVRYTNGQVLLSQIFAGVGFGLVFLGMAWMVYWLRAGWLGDGEARSTFGGMDTATYFIGAPAVVLGMFILFYSLGRVAAARRARNAAVVLMVTRHRGVVTNSNPSAGLPSGVSEQDIQDLMKRLDGLMAQLPDGAVTEFSKTKEADTYLKLLGS